MDLARPARSVVPTLDAEVLVVLAGTTMPLTGRQVHRLSGVPSPQSVADVLARLESTGMVDVTEAGRSRLYILNRDHVAADAVLALVDLRGRLFARIREMVSSWPIQPVAMSVFGSAARGDGNTSSDVDLFLVRPESVAEDDENWGTAVFELAQRVHRWSGNRAGVHQLTPSEVTNMVSRGGPIVASIRADEVSLVGTGVLVAGAGA